MCCPFMVLSPRKINASLPLLFCAAPYKNDEDITRGQFNEAFARIASDIEPVYILLDTHGGINRETEFAADVSDEAYIIASHQVTTVRAAEKTDAYLAECGLTETRLIINEFDKRAVKKGGLPGIIDIIDRSRVRLIGVIPKDERAVAYQEKGILCDSIEDCTFRRAFENMAKRTEGKKVPLFDRFGFFSRKIIMK